MNRRRFLTITAAAWAAPASAGVTTWQSTALGGTLRLDLRGPRALSADLATGIAATIEEVEAAASLFRPESALSQLNATGRLDDPPPALRDLLALADDMHRLTGGLFDPTVQPLWQALAMGRDPASARAAIGWDRVQWQGALRLDPGQALTLNGLAQGYAADRVAALLRQAGYGPALIDMGEFAVLGGPFRLGVEDPEGGLMATRTLTGGAMATSSPGAMRLGMSGHILGPQGQPPRWSTVSVEAPWAGLADGLSTAFCLMEADAIRAAAARAGATRVMAVDAGGDFSTLFVS